MGISGIAGSSGLSSYRISSVHGNPYSMTPVQKVGRDNGKQGKPLVIASGKQQEDLYVKDYGGLASPRSTAVGEFADMLDIRESMLSKTEVDDRRKSAYASYLNDTIGMMGLQNRLRDQLNGEGFTPFS